MKGRAAVRKTGFEQAKSTSETGTDFTNRDKGEIQQRLARQARRKKLTRVPFRVSRLMEFASRRELVNQTGHDYPQWPLVVLKELVDNALDAGEEAGIAPVISVTVEPGSIVIEDNGPGIPAKTIESILDYSIRVSSREAYVSPTRGAQGNALKTILPMAYVLDEKVAGAYWEQSRIEQEAEEGIVRYLSNLYEVQNREKSLFDAIVYESEWKSNSPAISTTAST
jgi:hypothetical protein